MHMNRLVVGWVLVLALVVSCAALAAPEAQTGTTPPPDATAKAQKAPDFDQVAALQKYWKAPDSTVIATVNGEKITKGELVKTMWDWNAPAMLNDLVTQRMIKQAATKAGVKLTDADIEKRLQEQVARMPGVQDGDWKTALRGYNMTEARFRQSIAISLMAEKTVEKGMNITDAQLGEFVKARHILVRVDANATDKDKADADAKAKAEKAIADIKGGKKFEDVAKEVSEDFSNKDSGGDLGWFKRGRMVKEFDDAVFGTGDNPGMKAGEMSEAPVKTLFGYHIILVEKLGRDASAEDKAQLKEQILKEEVPTKMGEWFNNLKSSAKIENLINPTVEEKRAAGAPEAAKPTAPKPAAPKPAQPKPKTTTPPKPAKSK